MTFVKPLAPVGTSGVHLPFLKGVTGFLSLRWRTLPTVRYPRIMCFSADGVSRSMTFGIFSLQAQLAQERAYNF
jgi:hypothetical protein